MDVDRAHVNTAVIGEIVKDFFSAFDIDAEFCFLYAGCYVPMCSGVNVGIYAKGGFGPCAGFLGESDEVRQLRFGFDVEVFDARPESVDYLSVGFADSCVDDL